MTEVTVRRLSTLLLVAGLAAGTTTASSALPNSADEGVVTVSSSRGTAAGSGYGQVEFVIVGKTVKGMYPGLTKDMKIKLANPYHFDLVVRRIEGRVAASSRRKCRPGPRTLATRSYQGKLPLRIRAQSTTTAGVLPLHMPKDASQDCQNTTFTIVLTGSGKKEGR